MLLLSPSFKKVNLESLRLVIARFQYDKIYNIKQFFREEDLKEFEKTYNEIIDCLSNNPEKQEEENETGDGNNVGDSSEDSGSDNNESNEVSNEQDDGNSDENDNSG